MWRCASRWRAGRKNAQERKGKKPELESALASWVEREVDLGEKDEAKSAKG